MSERRFDLSGRTALVTGANTGLGQAIAVALAEAGADIVAVGRSSMDGDGGGCRGTRRRLPGRSHADLATLEPIERVVREALTLGGRIDILVNNAGIIRRADSLDFTEADWDAVMDVNLEIRLLPLAGGGAAHARRRGAAARSINVASLLSFQGGIRIPSYTASKSGLAGLTRLLACEWAGKGHQRQRHRAGLLRDQQHAGPARGRRSACGEILARIPAGRWGDPPDIGGAAVFLASPAADYVHGIVLPVDGGWLAR